MHRIAAAAAFAALSLASSHANSQSPTGCYLEGSGVGISLSATGDRIAGLGLGGGCEIDIDKLTAGAFARADFGNAESWSVGLKAGINLNPGTKLYGFGAYQVPEFKFQTDGAFHIGAGIETKILDTGLAAFVEASTAVSGIGTATTDDIAIRAGARYRLGAKQ